MSKNLYVGNLSYNSSEDQIRDLFSQHGTVTTVNVITDRETGRARGFAFVEMAGGGDDAIRALNNYELDGRTLMVSEARPRERRGAGSNGGFNGGGGQRRW